MDKILTEENVADAANKRIEWIFDTFSSICLSFSGGKDSTVLFHITANIARKKKKKFSVLFIDWEAQYQCTIEHVQKMKEIYHDVTDAFYWVALPLTTVNGVSQYQPEWVCWQPGVPWVRHPPEYAITDSNYFPFYQAAMTFEEFIPSFSLWFSQKKRISAILTGVRADESLNRFIALTSQRKSRYDDKHWTTVSPDKSYFTATPLYDWKTKDIWIYNARNIALYNPLYDLMYRAGIPIKAMRVCEPFGPEQRRGLWLYHVLEPETWARMCVRVSGASSGAIYADQSGAFYALRKRLTKPPHHSWRSYAFFLLDVMPENTAEHYKNKIAVYLHWYQSRGYPIDIPDEQENDLGSKDIPSWRRICRTLLKNDYWCRNLSFSPNKPKHYERYLQRMRRKRKEWGIL
ncbi:phosphoadenosine phosphosulfate reductase [Yersinia enterocolitica]|uniref:phosphoadenosine phosphosulfate reductase n=1 Tax=Yersinia enterocolitica TaxID=630 RepID=UPI0037D0F7CC